MDDPEFEDSIRAVLDKALSEQIPGLGHEDSIFAAVGGEYLSPITSLIQEMGSPVCVCVCCP